MSGINENSIVEKSRFLLGMKAPNYELGELKILDTYLARINARDPETQAVTFTKEEYESLMGFTDSRPETLKKRTEGLLGKVVTIPLEEGKKGWRKLTLFTKAECIQDEYGGYIVNLNCNPELQPIFFNVENAGYLRYRLKNILPLTSKYSALLYIFLKDNMFRTPFEVSLRELKERLNITAPRYDGFKYLRAEILDKAINEINEKTDIDVSFERKTRGRITVGLIFNVKGKPAQMLPEEELEQLSFLPESEIRNVYDNDLMEFYAEAFNFEFTQEQLNVILSLPAVQQQREFGLSLQANQMKRRDYLEKKYAELNYRCSRADLKPINDRFAYIKSIIEAD